MKYWLAGVCAGAMALTAVSAQAVTIAWADWTSASPSLGLANGSIANGMGAVTVDYMGPAYTFALVVPGGGTYYYTEGTPAPYTGGDVDNAPSENDILALSTGGTSMITFSVPVVNPVLALVSWNGNTVDFGTPIEIVSFGAGFFGNGIPELNMAGTGFFGNGEVHGIVRILGTHDKITFSHTGEFWHGLTVGIEAAAQAPEAAPLALLGSALAGVGFLARRKR